MTEKPHEISVTVDVTAVTRKVVVVTADAVEDTGTISFKFMIDAKLHDLLDCVPQMWAWVWHPSDDREAILINVFKGGSGMQVSGPLKQKHEPILLGDRYQDARSPEEIESAGEKFIQEVWSSIPSCTILMTTTVHEWFKEAAAKYGLEYQHIHHEGFLKTS